MEPITIGEILEAVGGTLLGEPCDPKTVAGGILITAGALLLVL